MALGFDFPKDQGNVNGSGMFDAWGPFSAPLVMIQGVSATWTQGGVQMNGQTSWWFPTNGTWAAEVIGNIPAGTSVTLTVTGMSMPDPTQPPVAVPESITFTFQGPSPQVERRHRDDDAEEW